MLAKLYRGDADFDFERIWPRAIALSLVLVVVSLGSFWFRGLNLGIDFVGGGVWDVPTETSSVSDIREALRPVGKEGAKIQVVDSSEGRRVRVQADLVELGPDSVAVTAALAEETGTPPADISVSTVGPSWGEEITRKTAIAVLWFFVLISLYIAWRLEWRMAAGALVAVIHDIIISVGVYSVFQFEVTPATAIAFLTIMGYSLYDTLVVYDKARVNEARMSHRGKHTYAEMMSLSMNQVLMRSVNTTLTSIIPVLSMLLVGSLLLGAVTLQEFGVALLIGLLVGAYSSIFVAVPVVVLLKEREPRYREARARRAESIRAGAAPKPDEGPGAEPTGGSGPVIEPRARKKGRKR